MVIAATLAFAASCSEEHQSLNPTAPTPPSSTPLAISAPLPDNPLSNSALVAFPPRNESFNFRNALELHYRDQLRRQTTSTFVDNEGDVVWTQEYLRYRVNRCSHDDAVQRTLEQIDGRPPGPVCGDVGPGPVAFPPRNESFAFRQQLELKYRDGLHRAAVATYVDPEGAVVWLQEYLRYRVNQCSHAAAESRVFDQIRGRGIGPGCNVNGDVSGL